MKKTIAFLLALCIAASIPAAADVTSANSVNPSVGFEVRSQVDPETLTITGIDVDAAKNTVLLKVGAETTANVDSAPRGTVNISVRKGSAVTVRIEHADTPGGPWSTLRGVSGTATIDKAGADVKVKLDGELPAGGFFRVKVEESSAGGAFSAEATAFSLFASTFSVGSIAIVTAIAVLAVGGITILLVRRKKK